MSVCASDGTVVREGSGRAVCLTAHLDRCSAGFHLPPDTGQSPLGRRKDCAPAAPPKQDCPQPAWVGERLWDPAPPGQGCRDAGAAKVPPKVAVSLRTSLTPGCATWSTRPLCGQTPHILRELSWEGAAEGGGGGPWAQRWPHFQVAECGKATSEHLQEMERAKGRERSIPVCTGILAPPRPPAP